jgi:hypothetical protein
MIIRTRFTWSTTACTPLAEPAEATRMKLFDLIKLWEPKCTPQNTKVHLARHNGFEDPLDVFFSGDFEVWQSWQSKHHFNRAYVLSLIQRPGLQWLFAGLFAPVDRTWLEATTEEAAHFYYDLERLASADEWVGRLVISSPYKERNSRPTGERMENETTVVELLPERLSMGVFPGFKAVDLTMAGLRIVTQQSIESWRAALASVKGIYLITDKKGGGLYVGKADGVDGIWGRWCTYAKTGHGDNVALKKEFGIDAPPERQNDLRFSILEIADLNATDIDKREAHWKRILNSRDFGYNMN